MTKEQVKHKIKSKFGSIARFARITGQSQYELQKLFGRTYPDENHLKRLLKLAQDSEVRASGNEISPEQVASLREALNDYGGVVKFARDHPEYGHRVSIFQILSGHRKRMTDKVRDLFKYFKIKTS